MSYKNKIVSQLRLSEETVTDVINELDSGSDWKFLCNKTGLAIAQLGRASELLRMYHLEVCILKNSRRIMSSLDSQTVNEIIKTYKS